MFVRDDPSREDDCDGVENEAHLTAHPMPPDHVTARALAARASVMAARAVRQLRRPVATIEQISA